MSDDVYSLCSIIPNGFPALKISWFLPFILSPLSRTPSNHWSFCCLHSSAFFRMSWSWNHTAWSLSRELSFTKQYAFKVPPYLMAWQLISFYHWMTFHCLDVPQFFNRVLTGFTYWKTSWLHPYFGNYDESCCKHLGMGFCVDLSFGLVSQDLRCRWSLGT